MKPIKEIVQLPDEELYRAATIGHQTNTQKMKKMAVWVSELAAGASPEIIAGKSEVAIDFLSHYAGDEKAEINEEYSQTDAIVIALLSGWPMVSIETFSPYGKNYSKIPEKMSDLLPEDQTGIALWKMFLDLRTIFPHIDLVTMIDEYNDYSESLRAPFLAGIIKLMHKEGALLDAEYPGEDYIIIPESRMAKESMGMIEVFKEADGELINQDGEIRFSPSPEKIQALHIHSKNRRKELKRQGVLLVRDNIPSCPLMDSYSYFNEFNYHLLHWNIFPESFRQQQDQAYTLLRCLDKVPQENYQNIYFPDDANTDVVVQSIAKKLIDSFLKAGRAAGGIGSASTFFPDRDADRNFSVLGSEEEEIITLAVEFLKNKKIDLKVVSDTSTRANIYPLFIWQAFVRDGLIFLENNVLSNRLWIQDQLRDPEPYWDQYQKLIREKAGSSANSNAQIELTYKADIEDDIERGEKMQGISGFFCFDRFNNSRIVLQAEVRKMINRLDGGGIFFFTHAIQPGDSVTAEEIEEIYRDQGVDYKIKKITCDQPDTTAIWVEGAVL